MEDRFFPTHLVVAEGAGRVTTWLYGRCKPQFSGDGVYGESACDCYYGDEGSLFVRGRPGRTRSGALGGRPLLDGHRYQLVDRD